MTEIDIADHITFFLFCITSWLLLMIEIAVSIGKKDRPYLNNVYRSAILVIVFIMSMIKL